MLWDICQRNSAPKYGRFAFPCRREERHSDIENEYERSTVDVVAGEMALGQFQSRRTGVEGGLTQAEMQVRVTGWKEGLLR